MLAGSGSVRALMVLINVFVYFEKFLWRRVRYMSLRRVSDKYVVNTARVRTVN